MGKREATDKRYCVSVTAAAFAKLKDASRREGVSIGELVKRALDRDDPSKP